MERIPAVPIHDHFTKVTDPRCANARHRLLDILVLAICAMLCGAEGWEDHETPDDDIKHVVTDVHLLGYSLTS